MAGSPQLYHTDWAGRYTDTDPWYQHRADEDGQPQGITTRHWADQTGREDCANTECPAKFTLFVRCHHCRRCGEVFCATCLKYQRRLSLLAHPDPNGKLYKVCKSCYDKGPQTLGVTRSYMTLYKFYKGQGHHQNNGKVNNSVNNIANFREKLDVSAECVRITRGFSASVSQSSSVKRLLHGLLPSLGPAPEWQKATHHLYGKMAKSCYLCSESFSLLRPKYQCVICGVAVCRGGSSKPQNSGCSTNDLLVYIPDGCDKVHPLRAEVAIVKIVGCPPKEPTLSESLDVCRRCHKTLEDRQVSAYEHQMAAQDTSDAATETKGFWDSVRDVDAKLREIVKKVDDQLTKFQELIDSLEVSPASERRSSPQKPDNKSNMQTLAKAQSDVGDHLTTVAMTIQVIRRLRPQTEPQNILLRNFIKSKCEFYQDNMAVYRDLARKLEAVTPPEVLRFVQATVDRNAINSCYITVKQLALEVLHLVDKHQLDSDLAIQLVKLEDVVQRDLQTTLRAAGEPWDQHKTVIDELLQQQVTNRKHRIIMVSRRRAEKYGSSYILTVTAERTEHTLRRVYTELVTKCADRSFVSTKERVKVIGERVKDGCGSLDWEVV